MTQFWITIGAVLTSVISAFLAYRSSKNATSVENRKVDQVAYDNAVKFYTQQLERLERQVDKLNEQLERLSRRLEQVTGQLQAEQNLSYSLREQIRDLMVQRDALEGRVKVLQQTLHALKHQADEDEITA